MHIQQELVKKLDFINVYRNMYATNLFKRMEIIAKEDYQNMGPRWQFYNSFTIQFMVYPYEINEEKNN